MRANRWILTIFSAFAAIGLQAQDAKTLFTDIPDSIVPLLTKVNREDCIDFLESKMKAVVENRFDQKSEMTDLSEDYVRMQMSLQSIWQMKVLPLSDTTRVVCIVETACGPACDSRLHFYTTDWKPLATEDFITLPTMDDFLKSSDSEEIYTYNEALRAADMLLIKADFEKESTRLTVTLTTPDYMSSDIAEKLKKYLCGPVTYQWKNGKFTR